MGNKNTVQFDLSKTDLMHFTIKKKAPKCAIQLPNGDIVKPVDTVQWLSIWVDPGLKFKENVQVRSSQSVQAFQRMARLANTERGLSPTVLRQRYLAFVTSIADYGSVI